LIKKRGVVSENNYKNPKIGTRGHIHFKIYAREELLGGEKTEQGLKIWTLGETSAPDGEKPNCRTHRFGPAAKGWGL